MELIVVNLYSLSNMSIVDYLLRKPIKFVIKIQIMRNF